MALYVPQSHRETMYPHIHTRLRGRLCSSFPQVNGPAGGHAKDTGRQPVSPGMP